MIKKVKVLSWNSAVVREHLQRTEPCHSCLHVKRKCHIWMKNTSLKHNIHNILAAFTYRTYDFEYIMDGVYHKNCYIQR